MVIKEYPSFVNKPRIKIMDDVQNQLRYRLTIPFNQSEGMEDWKAFVIMKNPSAATIDHDKKIYHSDSTINRVITYFYQLQFSEVTVINLFAKYDTESSELNRFVANSVKIIGSENDAIIKQTINGAREDKDLIIVAWGGYPKQANVHMKRLYKERIKLVEQMLAGRTVYYMDRMVDNKFPLHGMIWSYSHTPKKYERKFLPS